MNNIVLLVGKSGSGKSSIAFELEKYGFKQLYSYTTRPPRYEGEKGHIFVTKKEFASMKDDMCAYTMFNGYEYGATNRLVDESDVYVIDPEGVEYFLSAYKGCRNPIICLLCEDEKTLQDRMLKRGDSPDKVQERLAHDRVKFSDKALSRFSPDLLLSGMSIEDSAKLIAKFIGFCEA